MATPVTICNLALSRIGDSATVSSVDPPDGSAQAEACARLYPVALDACLDLHNWSFATRRASLSELAANRVPLGEWKKAYMLPADCKRVIDVKGACGFPSPMKERFEVIGTDFGRVVLTNADEAHVRYVCGEPKSGQFTGLFTDALAWLLASYLAGETIRGDSAFAYAQKCQQQFLQALSLAMKQDAREVHAPRKYVAPWIARR